MSEVFEATSLTSWAPMFSNLLSSSISLATVTPSLVISGAPNDFSMTTLRPFGPRVTLTASASTLTPLRIWARASCPNLISLAAMFIFSLCEKSRWNYLLLLAATLDDTKDIVLAHHQELFSFNLDLG